MNKRNVLLLIALIIGVVYLCIQISNITSHANTISSTDPQTAEQAGEAIGTAIGITLLMPHVILIAMAVIFNAVGWLGKAKWAALTAAILYTVGGVLGFVNFLFVLIPMVLCYIAYGKMKQTT